MSNELITTGIRGLSACALLLAIGCTPREWDSGSASRHSTSERQDGTEPATRPDQKTDGRAITADGVAERTKETLSHTGELAAKTKDEFVAKAKQRLAEMDQKLDEWEARSKPVADDARAKWDEEREVFRQRRSEMQEKLDRLTDESDDAWQDMKDGATTAWKDLADAFGKAAAHFDRIRSRQGGSP